MPIYQLNESNIESAVKCLCDTDDTLKSVVNRYGSPPLWERKAGFPTLVHIILEQQVSLASALACFHKLKAKLGVLTPDSFLTLSDRELLDIGYSRQKSRYTRILAEAITGDSLDLEKMNRGSDDDVFETLTSLTGIGPWTANIYLLMALGRPDIWPGGDLALEVALKNLYGLDHRPKHIEFDKMGEPWRPYRAVAARILWHYYLSRK